ncbi:Na+/H+ antiporter subunit D [Bacillus pumilus]|uniref:Cation:proton antiporter n=1 Tax=Bacillus pumilus (strain SAFR-032) TaxID=315750 RepID=A8FGX0_BACP2|nr:Na+/H+ antiporter subunit D [Bacillus pumilus]ABV63487.2 cation:proton antiporter [Bacillus pumilus SAFR-032]AVI42198.1 Na+/H+ antiporter subunit D [Bacillus pumilus]MBC3641725.1 Na+/H+ antiporter subunit D [Bacillus pumilus]MBC3646395.1 Na+/H+ antiporter subunit D [Bacillus pumilus]MBC3650757.1 Na+/H+ antiporter subunit D [Bacillus pumilus]
MNNLVILPILIPLLAATLLIFMNKNILLSRGFSVFASLSAIVCNVYLVQTIFTSGIQTLYLGGWKAPFGIALVADQFAALLVLTASVVGLVTVLFSFQTIGKEKERLFYYSGVQFLLAGVSGAFLTGDIFNLFVFFELLLMASYMLIVLGGSKPQLRESLKYIVFNIISSALFIVGVACLYAVTGTLNMADLSVKIAESGQTGLITVISILFMIVFGLKAGIFPLYFWLPGSYHAPPAAISALFGALLTKVGLYAIARVFTLIFIHDTGFTHTLMAWLAALTVIFGVIGSLAYSDVQKIVIYNIVTAVGVILFGIAANTPASLQGAIYYLIHDMVIKGALFMLAGALFVYAGTNHLKKMGGLIQSKPLLGWMFFISALSLAGIPPLSGFVGKLKIVEGGFSAGYMTFSILVLLSSLLVLYSIMRIFTLAFWGEEQDTRRRKPSIKGMVYPGVMLVILSLAIGLGTEFISPYINQAAEMLSTPEKYIQAVLKE